MFKTRFVAYLNDSYIYFLDNKTKKIYEQNFLSIKGDQIINEDKFVFELKEFIKINKIKISLFGYKINFIINDELNEIQKNKYKEIFEDYFSKINFIYITNIIKLKKDTGLLNINNDYIDYYYLNKGEKNIIRINKELFNANDFKAINHVINNIYKPTNLILFGTSKIITKLTRKIDKELSIKCSYQEKYSTYILNEYIKANTQ